MGQITSKNSFISRVNLRDIDTIGIVPAGQYVLVSTNNTMTEDGQCNFDAYVKGDGVKTAAALELKHVEDNIIEVKEYFDISKQTAGTNNVTYITPSISEDTAQWEIIKKDTATGRTGHITLPILEIGKEYTLLFDYTNGISAEATVYFAKFTSKNNNNVTVTSVLEIGTISASSSGVFRYRFTYNEDMQYLAFGFKQPAVGQVLSISDIRIEITLTTKDAILENTTAINNLNQKLYETIVVDTSLYAENSAWINDNGRVWASSNAVHCMIIPCLPNTDYTFTVTEKTVRFCFLKSTSYTIGNSADTCDGYSHDIEITETTTITSPSDAVALYILIRVNQSDFILPSTLSYKAFKVRDCDTKPSVNSDNYITSGAVWSSINEVRLGETELHDILDDITEAMWAKTTFNGSGYSTSASGATILLPAYPYAEGYLKILYSTSNIALQFINLQNNNAQALVNGISASLVQNSGYISATSEYSFKCAGEYDRIAIQIQSSTGSAAGDIARLSTLLLPVEGEKTLNKQILNAAYNAGIETLALKLPSYNGVRYPYTGEKIFDKTFSVTKVGAGVGNQGSCCYNGVVFGFSSNSRAVKICDLKTGATTSCNMGTNDSPSNSHNNSAFFTDEFYSAEDPFPIIGTSDDINLIVRLFRITVNDGVYSLELVQTITIEKGDTAFAAGNTYTYGNGKLFSLAENSPRTHWYVYEWDMPSLTQGDVTLTSSSANEHAIAETNNYQGMCYKDGYMFMPEKTSNSNIVVVNMSTDEITTHIPVSSVISAEIEDTWFLFDKLYFTTYTGDIYKVDLY